MTELVRELENFLMTMTRRLEADCWPSIFLCVDGEHDQCCGTYGTILYPQLIDCVQKNNLSIKVFVVVIWEGTNTRRRGLCFQAEICMDGLIVVHIMRYSSVWLRENFAPMLSRDGRLVD